MGNCDHFINVFKVYNKNMLVLIYHLHVCTSFGHSPGLDQMVSVLDQFFSAAEQEKHNSRYFVKTKKVFSGFRI